MVTSGAFLRLIVLIVSVVGRGGCLCIVMLVGSAQFKHRARLSHGFARRVQTAACTLSCVAIILMESMGVVLLMLSGVEHRRV